MGNSSWLTASSTLISVLLASVRLEAAFAKLWQSYSPHPAYIPRLHLVPQSVAAQHTWHRAISAKALQRACAAAALRTTVESPRTALPNPSKYPRFDTIVHNWTRLRSCTQRVAMMAPNALKPLEV